MISYKLAILIVGINIGHFMTKLIINIKEQLPYKADVWSLFCMCVAAILVLKMDS